MRITDGQSPTVTAFSTGTVSTYNGFYSGSLALNYTFGETMTGAGNTYFQFTQIGGNADASSPHTSAITTSTLLASGSHTTTLNLASLGLKSGSYYSVQLVGSDYAGNVTTSASISSVKFDNVGPIAPTLTALSLISTLTPTFNW